MRGVIGLIRLISDLSFLFFFGSEDLEINLINRINRTEVACEKSIQAAPAPRFGSGQVLNSEAARRFPSEWAPGNSRFADTFMSGTCRI